MDKSKLYGKDANELLQRWDDGDVVHTIEMGGLGPGYEQALQITVFEILRHLLDTGADASAWDDKDVWSLAQDEISKAVMPHINGLGLSGAQWGAALSLATSFYIHGPEGAMNQVEQDRRIMVSRAMPEAPAATA